MMDPNTAQVTPLELTTKLMDAAVAAGARVQIGAVQGIATEDAGEQRKVTGVIVDGETIPTKKARPPPPQRQGRDKGGLLAPVFHHPSGHVSQALSEECECTQRCAPQRRWLLQWARGASSPRTGSAARSACRWKARRPAGAAMRPVRYSHSPPDCADEHGCGPSSSAPAASLRCASRPLRLQESSPRASSTATRRPASVSAPSPTRSSAARTASAATWRREFFMGDTGVTCADGALKLSFVAGLLPT